MANIDKDLIKSLAKLLHESSLTEIEYEADGVKLRVVDNKPTVAAVTAPAVTPAKNHETETVNETPKPKGETITSPMVGVIYIAPEPDSAPYVKVGDKVNKGQTLFLIEAMKTFNAVRAPKVGTIKEILIKDSQPVEFGEALAILE